VSLPVEPIRAGVMPIDTWTPTKNGSASIRYVDIGSVDRDAKCIVGAADVPMAEAPSRARLVLKALDVLVSTVRPNLNAVAMVPPDLDGAIGSTGFTVLRPHPQRLDPRFLFYWVRTDAFVANMVKKGTGASYPAVSDRIVLDSKMPMPSLSEQRRIADILDKADAIRRKRKEAIALTEELLRSAFLEMFGDPVTNPKGWATARIGELCERGASLVDGPFGSSLKPEHYTSTGVRVVRNWNIHDDHFDQRQFKFVSAAKFEEIRRSEVLPGDILLTTKGTVGDVCLMPELEGPSVLSASGTVRLRLPPDDALRGAFVVWQMVMPSYKRYLHSFEAGSAQQYLNLSAIKKMRLLVPPSDLQKAFVRVRQETQRLAGHLQEALARGEDLFSSTVHRAFRGELTSSSSASNPQLALFGAGGR
jgi:type I restriction enzyme, S subunit